MTFFENSIRKRAIFLGSIDLAWMILLLFAFGSLIYIIIFFQNCVSEHNCDYEKFATLNDPLVFAIAGIGVAILLTLFRYIAQRIKKDIEGPKRCAELKKQIIALKTDYEQMKHDTNTSIVMLIGQKNSRLIMINNLTDLLRQHYDKELSLDLSFLCEKGLRFPASISAQPTKEFQQECDLLIQYIDYVLQQLEKKPHIGHK